MSSTHTYVTLAVSQATYDEIRAKLDAADYGHAFHAGGVIDMHGLALVLEEDVRLPVSFNPDPVVHQHTFEIDEKLFLGQHRS